MSTRSRLAAFTSLTLFAGTAFGDGIHNPTTQFVGNMGEGVSNSSSGGSPPPPTCDGTIDLGQGCTLTIAIGLGP